MSQSSVASSNSLSKYPSASFRELAYLSIPLILGFFSVSFMGFCDRLFLSHYSLAALEGSVSAGYLAMLFQHPIMRIATMSQVFVGLYYGSKRLDMIGPVIWQMIWLSIFSMVFTLPISHFVTPYFFGGTSIQEQANIYFTCMMAMNFLFPIGTAISAYFIGQGRMGTIFLVTLVSQILNVILDYLFIFGVKGVIPPMGIFGAALATGIAQLLFCIILMVIFLRKNDRKVYGTGNYRFNVTIFWDQTKAGMPRALGRFMTLTAWVCISRIMTLKGGDYLMVLSIGGSLIMLFTFISEGMLQAMIAIASNLMGSNNYKMIWKLVRSGFKLLALTTALLAIPYLVFPDYVLSFFFQEPLSISTTLVLKKACVWLWLFFFCYGFNSIGLALITAARDMTFFLSTIAFVWLTSFVPVYLGIEIFNWSADKLWLIMSIDSLLFGIIFLTRVTKEKWKLNASKLEMKGTPNS